MLRRSISGDLRFSQPILLAALLLVPFLFSSRNCEASTAITWTGNAGNGLWSTASNWSPSGAPNNATTYDMVFPAYGQSTNNVGTVKINTLTFTGAGNNITSTTGGSFNFSPAGGSAGVTVNAGVTGTNTVSIPINIGASFPINVNSATATLIFAGQISGNKQNSVSGVGTVILSSGNTYTQGTQVNSGVTIILAADQALGTTAAGTTIASGATLGFQGGLTYTVLEPITLGSGGPSTLSNFSGTNSFAGPITLASADTINLVMGTLMLNGTMNNGGFTPTITGAGDMMIGGVISGTGGLNMNGSGTVTLTKTETYTGVTAVNSGTLLVNGSLAGGTTTTVNSGGTLGGTGTVRTINVNSDGILTPGVNGSGTLNSGNVTLTSGAHYSATLTTASSNQLNVTGTVALGSSTLDLNVTSAPNPGAVYTLINNDGTDAVTGTFSGQPEGSLVISNGYGFQISYVGGTGNDVVLKFVPFVTSIANADANPSNAPQIKYTVTFSEAVKNVTTADFALAVTGGIAGASVASVSPTSGLNSTYTITVNTGTITADGTIGLNLVDRDTITDSANIKLGGTGIPPPAGGSGDGSFTGSIYTIHYFVVTSIITQDTNKDGLLDTIQITTNLPLSDDFSDLTMTVVAGAYTYGLPASPFSSGTTANDSVFQISLTPQSILLPNAGDTGNTPTVSLTANTKLTESGASGVILRSFSINALDKAPPVLITATWVDASNPGVSAFDSILLVFSEPVSTSGAVAVSDFVTPVTSDTFDPSSSIGIQGPSTSIAITLMGNPILSPGGTYAPGVLAAGSPSGVYVANGANVLDAVGLTAVVQSTATGVDIQPTDPMVAVSWNDATFSIAAKTWDLGTVSFGANKYIASHSFLPNELQLRNTGNVRESFVFTCTNSAPSGWTLASSAGANTFSMLASTNPPNNFTLDIAGVLAQRTSGPIYSGQSMNIDLMYITPTTINVGQDIVQSMTVTITAQAN